MPGKHPTKFLSNGERNPKWRQRPSGPSKNHANHYRPKQDTFLAIDGEGVTINGVHTYVLLMCSDGSILRDDNGISTVAALDWLIDLGVRYSTRTSRNRNVFVGFSISYDVNMILRDLSWSYLKELSGEDGGRFVYWRGYRIEWKPQKALHVSRVSAADKSKREGILVYDAFGFYQSSFVEAIKTWLGTDSVEYEFVQVQKLRRHEFTLSEMSSITEYCAAELQFLVQLLNRLNEATEICGLNLQRYDGAGAIAGALMRKHAIKTHLVTRYTQPAIATAVRAAYFGGRIEQVQYGTAQQSWDYDINSAYVRGLCDVPSLVGGVWKKRTIDEKLPAAFSLVHISWDFSAELPFYPFPYRQPNGFAMFPSRGRGWYWGVEVGEPYRRFPDSIEIDEWWEFLPLTNEKPYAFLWKLYQQRAAWKAAGNQAQIALKLGMNSLYGKHAQHVGWQTDEDSGERRPPSTHQLEYAGFTTAYTRAQLWMLAMQDAESIIAFQTDGIYSSRRLRPRVSDELGDWTEQKCGTSVFVQSGVYFTHAGETDVTGASIERCYSRGFDQRNRGDGRAYLSLPAIIDGWRTKQSSISVGCTRFVTFSSGVAAPTYRRFWRTWRTVDRQLSLIPNGTKRASRADVNGRAIYGRPHRELVRTDALYNLNPRDSEPYPLPWEPNIYQMDGLPDRLIELELKESEE